MDERFVSLATFVRANRPGASRVANASVTPSVPLESIAAPPVPDPERGPAEATVAASFAHAELVHDLTILQIAASEAFERSARRAIADLAHEVLVRELALAPVDIEALLARALAAFAESEPIAIVVAPADVDRVSGPLPIRSDAGLEPGDLIVIVRDGAFESPTAFRLADVLARSSARDAA